MRHNIGSDPDVIEMAATLSMDEFAIVGRLHAVWSWLDQHSGDGTNVRIVSAFLDRLTCCPGFGEAMRTVGWLDGKDGNLVFPKYTEHNGETAKVRATEAKRKADYRKQGAKPSLNNRTDNGTNVPLNTGLEKRREEKIDTAPQSPPKLPRSVAEAISFCGGAGVPDTFVKEIFLEHEGTAWTYAGKQITNFKSYASSRWMRVKDIQAQREKYMTAPKKAFHRQPAITRRAEVPPWMASVEEIKRLLPHPGVNAARLSELGHSLPREAWSMLAGVEEQNPLKKIMKDCPISP